MALKPATRDRLKSVGTRTIAAALAKRGLQDGFLPDLRPVAPVQDVLVGEACLAIESCHAGAVLVVEAGKACPPLALLMRRGIAGIVCAGVLREAAGIARAGLPAYQRRPASSTSLTVANGDVLVGDRAGVLVIAASLIDQIAEEAQEISAYEEFIAEQVNQGGGVYGLHIPSGEQARVAFAAWRKMKGR